MSPWLLSTLLPGKDRTSLFLDPHGQARPLLVAVLRDNRVEQRVPVGDVHHTAFVPETGGNVLNENVPLSILDGPSWSKDQLAASLPIPVGTAYGVLGASGGRRCFWAH